MVSQLKSLIIGGDTTVWNWLKYCFTDGGHHVIRQKGLPSAAIDVLPTGAGWSRGHPKLCCRQCPRVGWKKRQRTETSSDWKTPGDGSDFRSAPPLQFEDEVATEASLCRMMMTAVFKMDLEFSLTWSYSLLQSLCIIKIGQPMQLFLQSRMLRILAEGASAGNLSP